MVLTLTELSKASTSSAKQAEDLVARAGLLKQGGGNKKEKRNGIAVPVSSQAEALAMRREGYESTQIELNSWEPIVKNEARSDELRFGDRERGERSLGALSTQFRPETEFEKEMAIILNQEKGERAKTRSVLFHAEQKNKYHAKVKSKAFARGRKKKRKLRLEAEQEAAAENDPELRKTLDERAAKQRVEERVSLRHAATSAWAKNIKKRGRAAKEATSEARRDSKQIERELREKVVQDSSDSEDDDDDDEKSEDRESLEPQAPEDDATLEKKKSLSKIENMHFMIAARDQQAIEAARQVNALAKELAEDDTTNQDDQDIVSQEKHQPQKEPFTGTLRGLRLVPKPTDDQAWTEAVRKANRATSKKKTTTSDEIDLTIEPKEIERVTPAQPAQKTKKRIRDMTQDDLLELAMDPGVSEDFAKEKLETETALQLAKHQKNNDNDPDFLPGWGSWTGEGISKDAEAATKSKAKRKKIYEAPKTNLPQAVSSQSNLILNPKRIKKQANLRVAQVPYPFSSKAQYERYMAQPLGKEWNAEKAVEELTKPAVVLRPGVAVQPITKVSSKKQTVVDDVGSGGRKNGTKSRPTTKQKTER